MRRLPRNRNVQSDLGLARRKELVVGGGELRIPTLHPVVMRAVFLVDAKFEIEILEFRSIGGLLHVLREPFNRRLAVRALTPFEIRSYGFCVERDRRRRRWAMASRFDSLGMIDTGYGGGYQDHCRQHQPPKTSHGKLPV